MHKSCGWFVLLSLVCVNVSANESALALPPLSSKRPAIYFLALALSVVPLYAQNTVSLQELFASPNDPANTRAYLKTVLREYWKVRLTLGSTVASVASQSLTPNPKEDFLKDREKKLEQGIRELLAQLVHSDEDKKTLKVWAKGEHVMIPWNLGPRLIGAAS